MPKGKRELEIVAAGKRENELRVLCPLVSSLCNDVFDDLSGPRGGSVWLVDELLSLADGWI